MAGPESVDIGEVLFEPIVLLSARLSDVLQGILYTYINIYLKTLLYLLP